MHLGLKIKLARVAKGLKQEDLAEKINKTRPLISQIEKSGKVNYYTLQQICKVLEINPDDLDDTNRIASEPANENVGILKNEIRILRQENKMLKDLIKEQKDLIKSIQSSRKK